MGIIIGLTGKAGVGKDTVADILVQDYGFQKRPIAEPIKALLNELTDWSMENWASDWWKDTPQLGWDKEPAWLTPRRMAQWLGTEVGRELGGPDVWIRRCLSPYDGGDWVIPDVRFPNEVDAIDAYGGYIVGIQGPSRRKLGWEAQWHVSESAADDIGTNFVLRNEGTTQDLRNQVEWLVSELRRDQMEDLW